MHESGKRLKKLREQQELTQVQVAERPGLSKAVISSYEVASPYPSYDVLIKMAALNGVTTNCLPGLDNRRLTDSKQFPFFCP